MSEADRKTHREANRETDTWQERKAVDRKTLGYSGLLDPHIVSLSLDRQADRQTGRQTDRQTDRQVGNEQTNKQTDRQKTDRQTDRDIHEYT